MTRGTSYLLVTTSGIDIDRSMANSLCHCSLFSFKDNALNVLINNNNNLTYNCILRRPLSAKRNVVPTRAVAGSSLVKHAFCVCDVQGYYHT